MIQPDGVTSHHGPCRHRTIYGVSCQEFDQLYADANGACQLCETPPWATKHGLLVLDHDNAIGFRAVRGLLCHPCNIFLGRSGYLNPTLVLRYVQNAWHLTHRNVEPVVVHVPDIPLADVPALLKAAKAACQDVNGAPLRDRAGRQPLVAAIRIAVKAGMRNRQIIGHLDRFWTGAQVYQALHERGCKVVGKIRTRDDDLVAIAAADKSFEFGMGLNIPCNHPDCSATIFAPGIWNTAIRNAEAAGWRISHPGAPDLCPAHFEHVECLDFCVNDARRGLYTQPPLFEGAAA